MYSATSVSTTATPQIQDNGQQPINGESQKMDLQARKMAEQQSITTAQKTFSQIIGMMSKKSSDLTDKIDQAFS